ncbi:MAG: hypothetical protein WC376_03380 [Candidatus Nanoarchaeia archaeon]|jgi:hypothetical protein
MNRSLEYIKNGLKNFSVYVSLYSFEKAANKYSLLSYTIKDMSTYLKGKDSSEEMLKGVLDLGDALRKKEAMSRLKGVMTSSKRKFLEEFINGEEIVNNELLNKYCLKIIKCVENINKKNAFLKIININNGRNEVYFKQIKENIKISSNGLFENLSEFSELVDKKDIVPMLD